MKDYRSSNSASPIENRGLKRIEPENSFTNNWLTVARLWLRRFRSMTASSGMGSSSRKFFRQNPIERWPRYSFRIGKPWVRQIMNREAYMRHAPSSRRGQGPKLFTCLAFCRMWPTTSRERSFKAMAREIASIGKTERCMRQQLPAHPFSQAICSGYSS